MGTGKTEIGRELSAKLHWRLIDLDDEIVKESGMNINEIFSACGEPVFREMETEMIQKVSGKKNIVISTGGGAVLRQENMDALRENGIVICLTATPETILRRTGSSDERPLLQVRDPLQKIRDLLELRRPWYEKADVIIDTEGKTPFQIAEEILEKVKWK